MSQLYIKEKVLTLRDKYKVIDKEEGTLYTVEGSFLRIPKAFTIKNAKEKVIGKIEKKLIAIRKKYVIELKGKDVATITKQVAVKDKFKIESKDIEIEGDWWNLNFEIHKKGKKVAKISKKVMRFGDTYELNILGESLEPLVIAIVVVIDHIREDD